MRRIRLALAAAFACAALGAAQAANGADDLGAPLPAQGASPANTNDFSCKPDKRHPYPVVLVHGTFGNMQISWGAIVPPLKRLGYCVYALDYGNGAVPNVNGTGDIPTSARQLRTFIDTVLAKTGASRVSIVGHSQGGMLPRYLIKYLSRAPNEVDDLVGLSPSSHGTTTAAAPFLGAICKACVQQAAGSPFIEDLNAGDETPGMADYTVIETNHDEVVTPYQSEFLRPDGNDVTNILLQDKCPSDVTEHVGIIYDSPAVQWMLNALGRPGSADPAFTPDCSGMTALTDYPNSSSVGSPSLRIDGLNRRSRGTADRRLGFKVTATTAPVRKVRLTIHSKARGGKRLGHSVLVNVTGQRKVKVRLRKPLAAGKYFVTASGIQTDNGLRNTASGKLKLR